jgi:hypothetical protein
MLQINNYAELVAFVRSNAMFCALSNASEDAHVNELQAYAQRTIVDFVLADAHLRSIAEAEHNETDECVLHEWVFDDCV